jgi:hypothetical protein
MSFLAWREIDGTMEGCFLHAVGGNGLIESALFEIFEVSGPEPLVLFFRRH